jgi:hypothetical protein
MEYGRNIQQKDHIETWNVLDWRMATDGKLLTIIKGCEIVIPLQH